MKQSEVRIIACVLTLALCFAPGGAAAAPQKGGGAPGMTVSISASSVVGGGDKNLRGTVTLTLAAGASTSSRQLPLSSSDPSVVVPRNVTLTSSGSPAQPTLTGTFQIFTRPVARKTTVSITAGEGLESKMDTLIVNPPALSALRLSASTLPFGSTLTGTVVLTGEAPAEGLAIPLSGDGGVTFPVSPVTVPGGQTSATFQVMARHNSALGPAKVTAGEGAGAKTADLLLIGTLQVDSVTLSPTSVKGGETVSGTVTLDGDAPEGGTFINLQSGIILAATVDALTVPAGQRSATFQVTTKAVRGVTAFDIVAKTAATRDRRARLTVRPPSLTSFICGGPGYPSNVMGGVTLTCQVGLDGPAPATTDADGSAMMILVIGSNQVVAFPAGARFAPNRNLSNTFDIFLRPVNADTPVTLTAGEGSDAKTIELVVKPLPLKVDRFTLNPQSVTGGTTINAEVELNSDARSDGFVVQLSSNTPAATVPATVTVPANQRRLTFQITTTAVEADANGAITAGEGANAKTSYIVVRKP